MFLLLPAYPGSPGQKAVKRLCVCVYLCCMMLCGYSIGYGVAENSGIFSVIYIY